MIETPSDNVTFVELLGLHENRIYKRLHVALPARVVKYDAKAGTVDVKPLIKEVEIKPETEEEVFVSQPQVNCVPLVFPGGGRFRVTFPIAVGDIVLLVVADRSIEEWMFQGGEQSTNFSRRHDMTDAIAIPGLNDQIKPWTGAHLAYLTMGKDGGMQMEITNTEIHLGLGAVEQFVLGTTYRNAEHTLNMQLQTNLASLAAQLQLLSSAMALMWTASISSPLSLLRPGLQLAINEFTAAAAAVNGASTALGEMESNAVKYLSTVVKGT